MARIVFYRGSLLLIVFCFGFYAYGQSPKYQETLDKAKKGDPIAQNEIGDFYYDGEEGVDVNYRESVIWYKKSAQQGNSNALYSLGYAYEFEKGVTQDYHLAVKYYKESAGLGDEYAQLRLAYKYFRGEGINQDYEKCFYWAEKSALQGLDRAQSFLCSLYREGRGTRKNFQKALYWGKMSAEQGYTTAQNIVAEMFHLGEGLDQPNLKEAYYWYEKASESDDPPADAQYYFAVLTYDHFETPSNRAKAFKYAKECSSELESCKEILAEMYIRGMGTRKNVSLGRSILKSLGFVSCYKCRGDGNVTCKECNGYGTQYYNGFGQKLLNPRSCSYCNRGDQTCGVCGGIGQLKN